MAERRASRRDLFRLLGESLAEFAEQARPVEAARAASGALRDAGRPPRRSPPAPATEVPVERGRLVVDLAATPVPVHRGRRFASPAWPETVLAVRISPDHVAVVTADCPRCGGDLFYDAAGDAVLCTPCRLSFRLDGQPRAGAPVTPLRVYLGHLAGPRLEIEAAP